MNQHQPNTNNTMADPMVSLQSLRKEFGNIVAVDNIDLNTEEGELLVLLGPSGCGKTTTLRMVAGLESITDGTVNMDGSDVSQIAPQNRDAAMVFQNYALYPHKTVEGNIRFPLRKLDLSEEDIAEQVDEVSTILDIADLLNKKPGQLSGGQRQRVAVARAIAREPDVLLMDEPLSSLDAKLRVETRSELRDLQQRLGITTLYVTHDQEEAMSIADRIAIMNNGNIEQIGSPVEVYQQPNNRFVATFLGEPAMNLFPIPEEGEDAVLLPNRAFADVKSITSSEIANVGIRPEDMYIANFDGEIVTEEKPTDLTAPIECRISIIEPIGRAYETTFEIRDRVFTVRTRSIPSWLSNKDKANIVLDRTKLYAFDEQGKCIADQSNNSQLMEGSHGETHT